MKPILLVVDMQNDFAANGKLPVHGHFHELVSNIKNNLYPQYKEIILTQDWHPYNHVSFDHFKPHCIAGSYGAEIDPVLLNDAKVTAIIRKGFRQDADSLGIVYDAKGRNNYFPLSADYDTIDICGVARELCVLESAEQLICEVFNVRVLWNYTLPVDPNTDAETKEILEEQGVEIVC